MASFLVISAFILSWNTIALGEDDNGEDDNGNGSTGTPDAQIQMDIAPEHPNDAFVLFGLPGQFNPGMMRNTGNGDDTDDDCEPGEEGECDNPESVNGYDSATENLVQLYRGKQRIINMMFIVDNHDQKGGNMNEAVGIMKKVIEYLVDLNKKNLLSKSVHLNLGLYSEHGGNTKHSTVFTKKHEDSVNKKLKDAFGATAEIYLVNKNVDRTKALANAAVFVTSEVDQRCSSKG
ncbi:MAG: hypothetical protein OXC40_01935, partial [Proteobacteria bacterium]|nr:hypothetical protein [Pseudomonadota bacterium]